MRSGEKVKILLVDDHEENLLALEAILSDVGHHLVKAATGREALRHLLKDEFAVILLDVQMPGMDGFETAALIRDREKTRHIPIIFLTAFGKEEEKILRGYALGAVDYLFKPFVPEILRAKVEVLVDLYCKTAQIERLNRELQRRAWELEEANVALKREINERRKAEEQLGLAIAGARLGTWHWDLVTQKIAWSDRCRELFGVGPAEPISYERFQEALHQDDRERTRQAAAKALQEKADYDIEHRSLWPDGSLHWIASKGRGYYDDGGAAIQMQGVVLDITEQKRAEESLRRAHGELEMRVQQRTVELQRKNRDLETLLYVTSHDLREPLRAIENFSHLVYARYADCLDEKGKDFLRRVIRGTQRMDQLMMDVLALSRVQRMELPAEDVEGASLVREALRQLEGRIKETGAQVRVAHDLPRLRVDKIWGRQAIYNLIANALKFTCDGEAPDIEIAPCQPSEDPDPGVGLVVRDRGPGVAPEHAERIFQLFQRAVGREVEGTGAGLAIVRQIAERHGGRAWVQPRDGGGSEFFLTFGPAHAAERT